MIKRNLVLSVVTMLIGVAGFAQTGLNWSAPRQILPQGYAASDAQLVVMPRGHLGVSFRGSRTDALDLSGIYYTRSDNQGYSWTRPVSAVTVSGILRVAHELVGEGNNLMIYAAINRVNRFEVQQFLSVDGGLAWRDSEVVFSGPDPIRDIKAWQNAGRIYLLVLTERLREGGTSEFTFWLCEGMGSGAYWEPPRNIANFLATSMSEVQLVPGSPWPQLGWQQDGFQYNLLEPVNAQADSWRIRPVSDLPPEEYQIKSWQGISYRVEPTSQRNIVFNRTDTQPPTVVFKTTVPKVLESSQLELSWQGEDDYSYAKALRYELSVNFSEPILIESATRHLLEQIYNGNHVVSLLAIDEADNRQTDPTSLRFAVRVPPLCQIITPRSNDLFNQRDLTVFWEGTHNCEPENEMEFSLRVDDQDWSPYSPETNQMVDGLEDGEHVLQLRARDALGVESRDFSTVRFDVDATPPTCIVNELPRTWDQLVAEVPWEQYPPRYEVHFQVSAQDNRNLSSDLSYRYRIDDASVSEWLPVSQDAIVSGLRDGRHTIMFEARDEAGNIQAEPTILEFYFDTPPDTRVWLDEAGFEPRYLLAGKDDNSLTSDISFRWRFGEGSWTDWSQRREYSPQEIVGELPHGEHTWYVQARDKAGNVDPTPFAMEVSVDRVPPPRPENVIALTRNDGEIVELNWEVSPEQNVRYRVYRSLRSEFDASAVTPIEIGSERTRSGDSPRRLQDTTTYYYFVTAVDQAGNESEPSEAVEVEVLGEMDLLHNLFRVTKNRIDQALASEQFDMVLREVPQIPTELTQQPAWSEYPRFWEVSAKAGKIIKNKAASTDQLIAVRKEITNFLERNPRFPQSGDLQRRYDEIKSRILWARLKTFLLYGLIALAVLGIFVAIYRWIQNRRIPQMPNILADSPTDFITPSKEALKDPTVLRRWAEVQSSRDSAESWSRLAFAFHNIKERSNAIQALYKALELEPNNSRFHFHMGHFQKEADNLREAIRHFERYLALKPDSRKSAEEVEELLEKLKSDLKSGS